MTRPPRRRRGVISLSFLFVLLLLLVFFVVVWNTGTVQHRKLDVQNAADAAAHAAAVERARDLNTLVATQHLMGELQAVAVLAYTPGGMELEEKTGLSLTGTQVPLAAAFAAAVAWAYETGGPPPDADAFRTTNHPHSDCGGAVGAARRRLHKAHTAALVLHCTGNTAAALKIQAECGEEWVELNRIEKTAKTTLLPLKQAINHTLVPELGDFARKTVEHAAKRMAGTAAAVAGKHGVAADVVAPTPGLPVVSEEKTAYKSGWKKSQFVRAMTPWVQYWRQPVLKYARAKLPLSGYAGYYEDDSDKWTYEMARWQWEDPYRTIFFVLKDHDPHAADKGREPWAKPGGNERADDRFGLVGLGHAPPPHRFGLVPFPNPHPGGQTAFAQAMVYNANPQDPDRRPADGKADEWQRVAGWDTLNWDADERVPEWKNGSKKPLPQPRIKPNWRSTLVPATLIEAAAKAPAGADLKPLDPKAWTSRTH